MRPTEADLRQLTDAVVLAIRRLLPAEGGARRIQHDIIVDLGLGENVISFGTNVLGNIELGSSASQAVEIAAHNLLQDLQDFITIEQRRPWPFDPTLAKSDFSEPRIVRKGRTVEMMYGDPVAPVLRTSFEIPW